MLRPSGWGAKYCDKRVCLSVCMFAVQATTALWELTCYTGSYGVICHPAEATFPPLAQPKLALH